jgi:hypothetical protein
MTVEEFSARLQAIDAYGFIEEGSVSIQLNRPYKSNLDGWFYGTIDQIETLMAQAETPAAQPNPADAEYLSWGVPA